MYSEIEVINMLYDFIVKDYLGNDVKLDAYKGKVLLIVNTATKCGFTRQYDDLVYLYEEYKDMGLEILDFPCNQFFHQAPGNSEQIHYECVMRFDIEFPQFAKIDVNGENESPLYTYLKANTINEKNKRIRWNFTKFLVDREGNIVKRFDSRVNPRDIEKYIIELL